MMAKIVLAFFMFVFVSCSQKQDGKEQTDLLETGSTQDWVGYDAGNFTISYPKDWRLDPSKQMGTEFILYAPREAGDPFSENINLVTENLYGESIDLPTYMEASLEQFRKQLPSSKIVESKQMGQDDQAYHYVIFTNKQSGLNLKFLQYYWIKNGKAYIFTLTCEQSTFDRYKAVGQKIIESVQWK